MKTRFVFALIAGGVGLCLQNAWAFIPPKNQPLTNYDIRLDLLQASPAKQAQAAALSRAQGQAEAALEAQVPNARITRGKLLGTPALIQARRGFLTGPGGVGKAVSENFLQAVPANDPHRVIKAFLNEHVALFGHDSRVLTKAAVRRDYVTRHNGLHTTVWQQTLDDIPVFEAVLIGNVTRNDELVNISSHFLPNPTNAANAETPNRSALESNPAISAARAIAIVATNMSLALPPADVTFLNAPQGSVKQQSATANELMGKADVRLVWLPMDQQSMRLCWRVVLGNRSNLEFYMMLVDAQTGEILVRRSLNDRYDIESASYNVYTSDSPSPMSPGLQTPDTNQPPYVDRELETFGALDTNASPAGWIPAGDTTTEGNNAIAMLWRQLNVDADGQPIPDAPMPQATGTNRVFDFPLDLTQDPLNYASASTVQLFYRANWYHDRLYQLGFTEAAGNYQDNNFGRGGLGDDRIYCLVQSGADYPDLGYVNNSMFIPQPDGLNGYCLMFVFDGPTPQRDGSLDQEVVIHELTHGLSDRLVGGGVGISALQSRGMGEGWSDFYSLCLLSESTDDVGACYAEGGYVTYDFAGTGFEENYYFGIRRYPYTTNLTKNPLTFKDIDPRRASTHPDVPINPLIGGSASEVHNQGEVWCVTLREIWASLVSKYGWATGNELTLQLVTDGMKLCPPNPTFLEARDAIIQADQVDNVGENYPELWVAFAKRGMGSSATGPTSDTTTGVHEAFDLPPDLTPDGILEVRFSPVSGDIFFQGDTNSIYVRVSDGFGITNATVSATTDTGETLDFRNDGVDPDKFADDDIYSTSLVAPTNVNTLTITAIISAPDKTTSTNTATYYVFAPPPNDDFANATKVPSAGTNYFTSNKRATIETNEPTHAGIESRAASLWWNYTAAANTNLLVDAGGSSFRTIVAVYTNNTLSSLQPVASAVGAFGRLGPSVNFNVHAGVTYHIAVAGYDQQSVGVVHLNIAPGGQADTNAPVVTITSPPDGLLVTTNRLLVSASVVDPSPNPSGIQNVFVSVSSGLGAGAEIPMLPPSPSLLGPASTNWSSLVGLASGLNTIAVSARDYAGNRSAPVSVQVTYRIPGPANDYFVNAIALTNTSGDVSANNVDATKEVGEPNHAGSLPSRSLWWTYTPTTDGVLTLSTSNSTFDTVLAMYTGTVVSNLTTIASNDDAYDGAPGGFSEIVQAVRSNQTYRIVVDGYDGQNGVVFLSYSFAPATIYHVTIGQTAGGTVVPQSFDAASNATVVLTALPDQFYQFNFWDGSLSSSNNPFTIQVTNAMNFTAHFAPVQFTDGFESGDLSHLPWTTGGNKPWFVQTNVVYRGQYAARSGMIGNNQTSSLILTTNFTGGTGSFDYKVSSEQLYDYLAFYVDEVLMQQWSGEVGWANFTFSLSAGPHTLEWRYVKDPSLSAGLDAAFIDDVNLPIGTPIVPPPQPTPPQLQVAGQTNGVFTITVTGGTNEQYILQTSTNLMSWQSISTNTTVGGVVQIPDPGSVSNSTRFYRAVSP